MVRIGVDHNRIPTPVPIGHIGEIERRHAPVPIIEPESRGTAARQMPNVTGSESAVPMPMLKGVIQVKLRVVAALIVSYPLAVGMDVRRLGMTFRVLESPGWGPGGAGGRGVFYGGRSVRRGIPAANVFLPRGVCGFFFVLGKRAHGANQQCS